MRVHAARAAGPARSVVLGRLSRSEYNVLPISHSFGNNAWKFMRWIVILLAGCALVLAGIVGPSGARVRYKVQLIRATDAAESVPTGSTPVGSELAGILHGPFKWQHYWKICEQKVDINKGSVKRVGLINDRDVEIDLTVRNKRTVTAFQKGNFIGRTAIPVGHGLSLIGGARDENSGWFVVVRRDKPRD